MALTQIDDRGLKTPIDLLDGEKIRLGTDNDIQIHHTSGSNYIEGALRIGKNDNVRITDAADNTIIGTNATSAYLTYDGNTKLETTSTGSTVTGILRIGDAGSGGATNAINVGAGDDLKIFHDGTNTYLDNFEGDLLIRSVTGGDHTPGSGTYHTNLKAVPDGAVELYYDNSKKFETTSDGAWFSGHIRAGDDSYLKLGASGDLEIYHDGSDSFITNATGGLNIASADGQPIFIRGGVNMAETMAAFNDNGAVELYHNNTKKFETTTDGITVTGDISIGDGEYYASDNGKLRLGSSQDLQIWHDGSHSYLTNSTGQLVVKADEVRFYSADGQEDLLHINKDGAVKLYYDNSKKLETISSGIRISAAESGEAWAEFYADEGDDDNDKWRLGASTNNDLFIQNYAGGSWETNIKAFGGGAVELYYDNSKKFETRTNGFMSQGAGEVYIAVGSTDASGAGILIDGDSNGDFSGADYASIVHNTNGDLILETRRPAASNAVIGFKPYDGSDVGYAMILAHDACWSYHAFYPWTDDNRDLGYSGRRWDDIYATNSTIQTSDRNTKDNITDTDLGLPFINKLTPKSYKFKGKTRTHYGLIAQDVETVLSDISKPTSGFAGFIKSDVPVDYYTQHDESIPEGKSIGDVKNAAHTTYGLRYSEFIAPLIKAVQELSTEVETLKTKVAALEAK